MVSALRKSKTNAMKNILKLSVIGILMSVSVNSFAQEKPNNKLIDKLCKNAVQTMDDVYENGALTQCHFSDRSLLSAYQEYRDLLGEDKQFLEAKLEPNKNKEVICSDDNCLSIIYRWSGENKLEIEQSFSEEKPISSLFKTRKTLCLKYGTFQISGTAPNL